MLEPLWLQSSNKTVEGWPVKFSALLEKLQQHSFCPLMPDETKWFNQQESLKAFLLHSYQGIPTQDLVGSIVGYAVAHDQDSDSDIHKLSAALLRLRYPGLFDTPRCVYFLVMCKGLKGNPRKPSPYLLQTASARLESSPCILSYQRDSEEQSDQPDSEEQGDQPDMWGQCHPRSLLESVFLNDWYQAASDLWKKAEAKLLQYCATASAKTCMS